MAYDNTDSGALFVNKKRLNDNSPNSRGSASPRCPHCGKTTEFWVSAWTKISKAGERYMSLAFTPKEEADTKPKPTQPQQDFDDDIPF